jgi:Spy/CpxP family protein refolding chaperone
MSMAAFTFAGGTPQEESTSNPPNEGAPASGRPGRAANVNNRLENLSKQLNLTDQQKEKIRPLLKNEVERIKKVRSNASLTQGEARRRIATIRRNTNQHIAEFLTPEQKRQWQELRQERRGGGPEGGQGGPVEGGGPDGPQNPPKPQ